MFLGIKEEEEEEEDDAGAIAGKSLAELHRTPSLLGLRR